MWQRTNKISEVNPWFLRDSEGFQLIPELEPRADEVIFDKITMSAFEGTFVDIALRDCGINSFAIVGVATEIGIEPTVRNGADRGYIPVVVTDACGAGDDEAGARSIEEMKFTGDAVLTDVETICSLLKNTNNLKKLLLPTSYFLLTKFAYAKRYPLGQRGAKCGLSVNPPKGFSSLLKSGRSAVYAKALPSVVREPAQRNCFTATHGQAAPWTTSRYFLLPTTCGELNAFVTSYSLQPRQTAF